MKGQLCHDTILTIDFFVVVILACFTSPITNLGLDPELGTLIQYFQLAELLNLVH